MTIASSSLLVEFSLSCWSGQRVEKRVTEKVVAEAGATRGSGKFTKNTMAGTDKLKRIISFAQSAREYHYKMTMPWSDASVRLLPMSLFYEYKDAMRDKEEEFHKLVDGFVSEYDTLVEKAKFHLGSMFDPNDYPPASAIKWKFGFKLVLSPVPEAGDFRIDMENYELDKLRRDYEEAFDERLADAMRHPWEKLHASLMRMSEWLSEPENGENKRYHESVLASAQEQCDLLRSFNLTGDAKLEEARQALARALHGVDIDGVREDPMLRSSTKNALERVLENYW